MRRRPGPGPGSDIGFSLVAVCLQMHNSQNQLAFPEVESSFSVCHRMGPGCSNVHRVVGIPTTSVCPGTHHGFP